MNADTINDFYKLFLLPKTETAKLFQHICGSYHSLFNLKDIIFIVRDYYWYKPPTHVAFKLAENKVIEDKSIESKITGNKVVENKSTKNKLAKLEDCVSKNNTDNLIYDLDIAYVDDFLDDNCWEYFPALLTQEHVGKIGRVQYTTGDCSALFIIYFVHPSGKYFSATSIDNIKIDSETETMFIRKGRYNDSDNDESKFDFNHKLDTFSIPVDMASLPEYHPSRKPPFHLATMYKAPKDLASKKYKIRLATEYFKSDYYFSWPGLTFTMKMTGEEYNNVDELWRRENELNFDDVKMIINDKVINDKVIIANDKY